MSWVSGDHPMWVWFEKLSEVGELGDKGGKYPLFLLLDDPEAPGL